MNNGSDFKIYLQDVIDGREALCLPMVDVHGVNLGHLRPVTRADLDHDAVVQALTDWRNANMKSFFGQFVATCDRTRSWMRRDLLATGDKMLFMIHVDGERVGHYGFKDLRADDVLLDNAMLGVRCSWPGVMREAGRALINWLFAVTSVQRVWGEVLTTNAPALMMNRELGFSVQRKLPMLKRETDGQTTWVMGDESRTGRAEVYCYKLMLERALHAQLPWARSDTTLPADGHVPTQPEVETP